MKKLSILITISLMVLGQTFGQTSRTQNQLEMENQEQYTFQLSDQVNRQEITFKNRYGITVSADLYLPVR